MGLLQKLFGKSEPAVKIRGSDDLEKLLLILVFWPPMWKDIRAGKQVNQEDLAVGGQIQALVTLGEATQYLDGDKEREQLSESARFVIGGLRDILRATEGRTKMLSDLEASVKGPHKAMLAMLLALHGEGSVGTLQFKFKDATAARQRLENFQE